MLFKVKKMIKTQEPRARVDVSDLRYAVEWVCNVWIQNARAGHSKSSDPDEQGGRATRDHRQENARLGSCIPLHRSAIGRATRSGRSRSGPRLYAANLYRGGASRAKACGLGHGVHVGTVGTWFLVGQPSYGSENDNVSTLQATGGRQTC